MACMAHVRRKYVEVFTVQGYSIAEEAIKRSAELYGIEKQTRGIADQNGTKPDGLMPWNYSPGE